MIMIKEVKSTPINYWNTKSKEMYSLNIQIVFIVYTIYINQINHKNFPFFFYLFCKDLTPLLYPIYIPIWKFL